VGRLILMVTKSMRAEVLRVPQWERFGWLGHGFSSRIHGFSTEYGENELNLGFTADDDPENIRRNRRLLTQAIAGEDASPEFVAVRQVHGVAILTVARGETCPTTSDGRGTIEADGLMTLAVNTLLAIQVADCVPVLVADTRLRAVAAFHAGWRGTVAGIVQQGIARMQADFGSRPEDLIGAVGPSIGVCCYTVGEEVRSEFERRYPYAAKLFSQRTDGLHLDLAEANRLQMVDVGLSPGAVTLLGECSACARLPDGRRKYFSHRAEQGFTGRMMAAIGVF
jgi:YfiH family protein